MYFHTTIGSDRILFDRWIPSTSFEMWLTCASICLLTFVYEAIKYVREFISQFSRKSQKSTTTTTTTTLNNTIDFDHSDHVARLRVFGLSLVDRWHLAQTILYSLQTLISYTAMMIVMTYQIYFFLAILCGATLGYAVFTPLIRRLHSDRLYRTITIIEN